MKRAGNADFLNKVIQFYQKNKAGNPVETGTVWDHLCRAIGCTYAIRVSTAYRY
ncbi:hypothetical protein OK016_28955 [Vibrio chagasii]|nr:hypothetical protein [Vibrio chagasii]